MHPSFTFFRGWYSLYRFSRHSMRYVSWHFWRPESAYKIVHIAGTNGKGSVSVKISSLLHKSNKKTGLFVSPHISSVRERIQIFNPNTSKPTKISPKNYIKYYNIIESFEKEWDIELNWFQFFLAMALLYFRDEKWEFVVLEWGIGGWSSQTNIANADYAVITSIGMDHSDVLGKTEKHICRDKAGILRDNIPVVVGPTVPLDIMRPICKNYNNKLVIAGDEMNG